MPPPPTIRSLELAVDWKGLQLSGTLHLPGGSGPLPLVVMMQGSGPMDRDSDGYFPEIRAAFVARGIAIYGFDKPGCGSSTGDWHDFALEARCDQTVAAIDVLRSHPRIDADRIGVFGHSQGGWMAQILAARDLGLRCAMATSGPTIGVADQDRHAAEQRLLLAGYPHREKEAALSWLARLQEAAGADVDFDTLESNLLEPARTESWFDTLAITDAADWKLTKHFLREAYQPAETLGGARCPFLAVYGGQDILVPAWDCSTECGRSLAAAPTRDALVVVFPNGDHRLRHPSGELVEGYLDLLADWAATRLGRPDGHSRSPAPGGSGARRNM